MSDSNSDDNLYDFAPELPARPRTVVKPAPVIDPGGTPILSYRAAREDKSKRLEPEQIKDVYLPLGLLVGGILVETLVAEVWPHRSAHPIAEMLIDLTIGTAIMLGAMAIVARLRNLNLGNPGVAAFKLAAVAIGTVTIAEFIDPLFGFVPLIGGLLNIIVQFSLFFALLGALFDLDESDAWFSVCAIVAARVGFYVLLMMVFGG